MRTCSLLARGSLLALTLTACGPGVATSLDSDPFVDEAGSEGDTLEATIEEDESLVTAESALAAEAYRAITARKVASCGDFSYEGTVKYRVKADGTFAIVDAVKVVQRRRSGALAGGMDYRIQQKTRRASGALQLWWSTGAKTTSGSSYEASSTGAAGHRMRGFGYHDVERPYIRFEVGKDGDGKRNCVFYHSLLSCGGGGVAQNCGHALPARPVLAVVGDIAGSWSQDEATARLVDAMRPAYVLTTGDNVYRSGTRAEYATYYAPTWGRHRAKTRPSPGNHDHATARLGGYCEYFGAAAHCQGGFGYYSFDVGDWHLISLDSGCSSPSSCANPMRAGSAMRRWLAADLARNTKRCTLAYWHHPRFSSGEHGNDARSSDVWKALYAANAEVVLNGHEHDYERFAAQTPGGTASSSRGLSQFVVGSGGTALRRFGPRKAHSVARNASAHGVLKLTLRPDAADFEFVPVAGRSYRDRGTVMCH